jgi:hypothetical protein
VAQGAGPHFIGERAVELLLIIIVLLLLFGGGGFYWRGRR